MLAPDVQDGALKGARDICGAAAGRLWLCPCGFGPRVTAVGAVCVQGRTWCPKGEAKEPEG